MKKFSKFLWTVLFLGCAGFSTAQESGEIEVVIDNIPSTNGQLRAALFDSPEGFPDKVEQSHQQASVAVTGNTSVITFKEVPFGEYVLAVFHDENNSGSLDTNLRGIPIEALGVSGEAKMKFGPPKYERAAFQFSESPARIEISLKQFGAGNGN